MVYTTLITRGWGGPEGLLESPEGLLELPERLLESPEEHDTAALVSLRHQNIITMESTSLLTRSAINRSLTGKDRQLLLSLNRVYHCKLKMWLLITDSVPTQAHYNYWVLKITWTNCWIIISSLFKYHPIQRSTPPCEASPVFHHSIHNPAVTLCLKVMYFMLVWLCTPFILVFFSDSSTFLSQLYDGNDDVGNFENDDHGMLMMMMVAMMLCKLAKHKLGCFLNQKTANMHNKIACFHSFLHQQL